MEDVTSNAADSTTARAQSVSSSPTVASTTTGHGVSGEEDEQPIGAAAEPAAGSGSTSGSTAEQLKSTKLNSAAAVFKPSSTYAAVRQARQGFSSAKHLSSDNIGVSETGRTSMSASRGESEAKLSAAASAFEPMVKAEVHHGTASPRIPARRVSDFTGCFFRCCLYVHSGAYCGRDV